jgi:putative oxidoreductase
MARFLATFGPLAGRVLLSAIFFFSGYQKLFGASGRAASSLAGRGIPYATVAAYTAGAFELVAALLLALGLKARFTALALVLYLVLVTWVFHWRPALRGDAGQMIQLLKNAGLMGGMLLLASHGAGPASIDRG